MMLPSEREIVILNLLEEQGVVTVPQICSQCNCSPQTARRDLQRLADEQLLSRTHGGAVPLTPIPPSKRNLNGKTLLEARTALVDRADVLIVTPSETAATQLLVDRAQRAGVPIIAESHYFPKATTLVAINNYQAGVELGRWVVNYARQHFAGQITALDVTAPMPNTNARSRGFADGLRELPPSARQIIQINGQGLSKIAKNMAADALSVHPNINVIFGINDDSALGALEAYRAAGLDERKLLVVSFGFEGEAAKDLLEQEGPYRASVAMFPELVGHICINAALCAYHGHPLPEHLFTPFMIMTPKNLEQFYQRDEATDTWQLNWQRALQLLNTIPSLSILTQCDQHPKPDTIGYVKIFSSHEWYQNMQEAMQARTRAMGISLEVVDASQDVAREIDSLKRAIGTAAANLVKEGDTIILDSGVTTDYLATALTGRQNITVITNSLSVLVKLEREQGIMLVSSGGVVRSKSRSLTGPSAEHSLAELRADKAFISASGLSLDFGLSNTNMAEATIKQAMIKAAREVILLADHTKIGVESLVKIADVDQIDRLITDAGISAHDRLNLVQGGVDVIIAEE